MTTPKETKQSCGNESPRQLPKVATSNASGEHNPLFISANDCLVAASTVENRLGINTRESEHRNLAQCIALWLRSIGVLVVQDPNEPPPESTGDSSPRAGLSPKEESRPVSATPPEEGALAVELLRKYVRAIDAIYNHNEAARTAVVQHFGTCHDPRVFYVIGSSSPQPQAGAQQ